MLIENWSTYAGFEPVVSAGLLDELLKHNPELVVQRETVKHNVLPDLQELGIQPPVKPLDETVGFGVRPLNEEDEEAGEQESICRSCFCRRGTVLLYVPPRPHRLITS